MFSIEKILFERLAVERPLFHCEADFQHALAWEIQKSLPDAKIRLEYRAKVGSERAYVDILVNDNEDRTAFELKYKTKKLQVTQGDESFELQNHGAQDCGRYDFLKDVQRLEQLVTSGQANKGIAIFLTNDKLYWQKSARTESADRSFKLHDGNSVAGTLEWSESASVGTMKGREQPIVLHSSYNLSWRDFSVIKRGLPIAIFRCLLLEI